MKKPREYLINWEHDEIYAENDFGPNDLANPENVLVIEKWYADRLKAELEAVIKSLEKIISEGSTRSGKSVEARIAIEALNRIKKYKD